MLVLSTIFMVGCNNSNVLTKEEVCALRGYYNVENIITSTNEKQDFLCYNYNAIKNNETEISGILLSKSELTVIKNIKYMSCENQCN